MLRASVVRVVLGLTAVACRPNTTRPAFPPQPEAAGTEVRLSVREATRRFAEALQADSLPVRKVELRDGYLETPWFDAASKRPTRGSPIGSKVVRVRAWADPARPGSSQLTVETVYRPLADPSLPERELEQEVAPDHPVALKMVALLKEMVQRYGGPPAPQIGTPTPSASSPDDE
jgi:hypothetical protein